MDKSELVSDWGRPKLKIPYRMGKRKHKYHPDILVKYTDGRIFLEEVKGRVFNKRQFLKKNQRANWYCKIRGWQYRVLYEQDIDNVL